MTEIDFWLWQFKGSSEVYIGEVKYDMSGNYSVLIPEKNCKEVTVDINSPEGLLIKILQDPNLKN